MFLPPRSLDPSPVTRCGWSWVGLVDRRCTWFEHALSMREVAEADADPVVSSFPTFFATDGGELFAHQEEWVFRSIDEDPLPPAVSRAYDERLEISSLVDALSHQHSAGCADLRLVRRLGELFVQHLLMEKEEIRPLVSHSPVRLGRHTPVSA
jgi:hypothetical protein